MEEAQDSLELQTAMFEQLAEVYGDLVQKYYELAVGLNHPDYAELVNTHFERYFENKRIAFIVNQAFNSGWTEEKPIVSNEYCTTLIPVEGDIHELK